MQAIQVDKAKQWAKQISITGAAQIIVQAVGFLSGILVIRLLPVEQYAYYTIANTMLGTMTVLSDGGISSGVMAQGGKVWQDKEKLGAVLHTGLHLRKRFAWGALVVSIPILCYLLWKQGADWGTCVLITASLIPAFFAALSDNILQIVPKLHQSITPLQKNQVSVGIGRLLLSGLTLFAFPWAFVAILASGIPRIWGNRKLKKIAEPYIDHTQKVNKEVQGEIIRMVKRIMPGAIYFALSGQITIWLLSIFGTTSSVAQIGALGRLGTILSVLNIIASTVFVPKFSKITSPKLKLSFFYSTFFINILFCCIILLLVIGLGDFILLLLGKEYYNLNIELTLFFISSIIGYLYGYIFLLYTSAGWVLNPLITIVSNILALIVAFFLFDVSSIRGVLYMNIFVSTISLIREFVYINLKMNSTYKSNLS